MAVQLLVGTALMIGLLVAVFLVSTRGRSWYSYTPQTSLEDVGWSPQAGAESSGNLLSKPGTWIVAFFLVVTLGIGGVFLVATGGMASMTTVLLGAVGALVVVYLIGGVYLVARQRGHSSAMAVMESSVATGAVFLLLVVVQLVALG